MFLGEPRGVRKAPSALRAETRGRRGLVAHRARHSPADQTGSPAPELTSTAPAGRVGCLRVNGREGEPVHSSHGAHARAKQTFIRQPAGASRRPPGYPGGGSKSGGGGLSSPPAGSIYHSCLAAPQAHPSPFPPLPVAAATPPGPALIDLITSCKMEPGPVYLSARPLL